MNFKTGKRGLNIIYSRFQIKRGEGGCAMEFYPAQDIPDPSPIFQLAFRGGGQSPALYLLSIYKEKKACKLQVSCLLSSKLTPTLQHFG